MNKTTFIQKANTSGLWPHAQGMLRRKCACGKQTVAGHECEACNKKKQGLQRKLAIGASNDPLEQEADRVADQVMAAPTPFQTSVVSPRIQRFTGLVSEGADTVPASVNTVIRGSGRPLEPTLRQNMESRFGHDFSQVRVHTGSAAEQSAENLNAHAYTVGHNIVFGSGQAALGTSSGRKLLAHELTHVVQQNFGTKLLQRKTKEKTPCAVHAYDNSNPKDTAVIPKNGGIGVSSVADLVSKVNAHVDDPKNSCSCVSRLEINGHGTDGYQSVGNGNQYVNDDKALVHDSSEAHLSQMVSIKFCSTGLLLLMGCHVGQGKGKVLLSRLSAILPGKLIGGAQHYTRGTGLGRKRVFGEGDKLKWYDRVVDSTDPFLTSPYVRWHITLDGKEYVINGADASSSENKAKLKKADKIKVKTPEGEVEIK